ncbi:MAG: mevalonate kinase [Thermoprotei archaeon]|jgi:mevalonate kinase
MGYASVPGKVTLLGEHAVVYGYPALVMAINLYTSASSEEGGDAVIIDSRYPGGHTRSVMELDGKGGDELPYVKAAIKKVWQLQGSRKPAIISINSELPYGSGLGSSASVSVAALAAYLSLYGAKKEPWEIAALGREVEAEVQGRASPMDTLAVSLGGTIKVIPPGDFEKLNESMGFELLLACVTKELSTGEAVAFVRRRKEELGSRFIQILDEIGSLVEESVSAIKAHDTSRLFSLINRNEELLEELGIVTPRTLKIVHMARELGAACAKISGGGFGGCVLVAGGDRRAMTRLGALADRVFVVRESKGMSYQ